MAVNPLVQAATGWLREAGFEDLQLIRDSYDPKHFGNGEVIFKIGRLYVRFLRDRSQDFVDLAASASPQAFHQFSDVEIAMGWKSVEEVLARDQPEEVPAVLKRLSERFQHLEAALIRELQG